MHKRQKIRKRVACIRFDAMRFGRQGHDPRNDPVRILRWSIYPTIIVADLRGIPDEAGIADVDRV